MGGTSFKQPHEELEQFKNSLDIISIIQEIVRNPQVGDKIKDLSQKITSTQELSESKKKALAEANTIIAQAAQFVNEFEAEKAAHTTDILTQKTELENGRNRLKAEIDSFNAAQKISKDSADTYKVELEQKLYAAKQYLEEANARHAEADQLNAETESAKAEHAKVVDNFLADKAAAESALESARNEHEENVQKLADERKAFELRKKRFDDALKE